MGGKRVDFEGDEGKALAYLSAYGYTAAEVERITGRSDDSVRRAVFVHEDSREAMQKEANGRNIVRNGYFEITVMYLYGIGKETSEISEYLGKCKASIREVKNRYKTREKVRSNRDILQSKVLPPEEILNENIDMADDNGAASSTRKYGYQEIASPQEAAQRAAERRTQGRKGCKSPRMNVGLSSDNYDYVRVMSQATGTTLTGFINLAIERDREAHADTFGKVIAFRNEYKQAPIENMG